ncbi:MAG: hypothetical protein ACXVB9_21485 [Bdellovibrionota bacterium]
MAALEASQKKSWKAALRAVTAPWVVCGITRHPDGEYAALDGIAGLIDWSVHGQVSKLLKQGNLEPQDTCVLPGDPARQRPSFLLFPASGTANSLTEKLRKLGVTELALAETTFGQDFLAKVKQTFKKEGIRCTTLEPEPDESR